MNIQLNHKGQQMGAFSREQVEGMIRSGAINYETLAWTEGQTTWKPIYEIIGASVPPPPLVVNHAPVSKEIHPVAAYYGPWREGKLLVIRRLQSGEAVPLPHRCVKCNQPGKPLKEITYVWSNPLLLFLLLVPLGIFILLFGYFIYRKKIKMAPVLCERHQLRDKIALTIGLVGPLLSLGLIFYAMIALGINSATFFLGWIFLISSLIAVVILRPSLRPSKIDNAFARFRGCDKHYLNNLPPFTRFGSGWETQGL